MKKKNKKRNPQDITVRDRRAILKRLNKMEKIVKELLKKPTK